MLEHGGLYINHSFLPEDKFEKLDKNFFQFDFEATYQPSGIDYGNRLQAYPCYDTGPLQDIYCELHELLGNSICNVVGRNLTDFQANLRYVSSKEIQKSKQNQHYGISHADAYEYAGIIYFEQTTTGGTAFFRTPLDIYPDMEVGAIPNRVVMYRGDITHAPAHDFSYDYRRCVVFFFNL